MKKYLTILNYKLFIVALAIVVGTISCEQSNLKDGIREVNFKPTANSTLITVSEAITYTDSSKNVASRLWSFESGNITSSGEPVVDVTYDTDGTFITELEVTDNDGTVTSNAFEVRVFPKVTSNFSASSNTAIFNSEITFTNTSENTESAFEDAEADVDDFFLWEFEGGIPATSSEMNPVVRYPNVGEFDVKLTVYRRAPKSGAIAVKEGFITIVDAEVISPATTRLAELGSKIHLNYDVPVGTVDASSYTVTVDGSDLPVASVEADSENPNA